MMHARSQPELLDQLLAELALIIILAGVAWPWDSKHNSEFSFEIANPFTVDTYRIGAREAVHQHLQLRTQALLEMEEGPGYRGTKLGARVKIIINTTPFPY